MQKSNCLKVVRNILIRIKFLLFMSKGLVEATSILVGTTIGAGILALPYTIQKAGFLTGLLTIIFVGLIVLCMNIMLGKVTIYTKGLHQLTGYAKLYIGETGKRLMAISMIIGIYGALLAYIIGEGATISAIFGGPQFLYSAIFFVIASYVVFKGIKQVAISETYMVPIVVGVILLIMFFSLAKINIQNISSFKLTNLLIPYGSILFAFLGTAAIPEMREKVGKNKKVLTKSIVIGFLIPLIFYIIFAFSAIGVLGKNVTQVATIGLGTILGYKMVLLGNIFAIFAMATSFITLGLAIKEMYNYDYKIEHGWSFLLAVFIPFLLFLIGLKDFITVISLTGALAGGLDGILIAIMYVNASKKLKKVRERDYILSTILILAFIFGIIYTLFEFF